jgi:hypothetical protein
LVGVGVAREGLWLVAGNGAFRWHLGTYVM